jgi:hypothetical protein
MGTLDSEPLPSTGDATVHAPNAGTAPVPAAMLERPDPSEAPTRAAGVRVRS